MTLQKQGLKFNRICHDSQNATTICPRGLSHICHFTLTPEFFDFCRFKFSSHCSLHLCVCQGSHNASPIIWHYLYHEVLVFEQPQVQRTLLKTLNNKNCQRVLGMEKQPSLSGDIFRPGTTHPLPCQSTASLPPFRAHLNSLLCDSVRKAAVTAADVKQRVLPAPRARDGCRLHTDTQRRSAGRLHLQRVPPH